MNSNRNPGDSADLQRIPLGFLWPSHGILRIPITPMTSNAIPTASFRIPMDSYRISIDSDRIAMDFYRMHMPLFWISLNSYGIPLGYSRTPMDSFMILTRVWFSLKFLGIPSRIPMNSSRISMES